MENRIRIARARAFPTAVLALVVSLLVTACGGGDSRSGGGPEPLSAPTNPVSISEANVELVAANAVEIAIGGLAMVDAFPVAVDVDVDPSPAMRVVSRITSDARRRVSQAATAAQSVTGAVQTEPCALSGSVTLSDTETSASITFNQCSNYEGEVVNGFLTLTNLTETSDGMSSSASATVSLDVTYTVGASTSRIVGGLGFAETWTSDSSTFQMTGSYLGYTDGVTTHVLSNFSFSESIDETSGVLTSSSNFTLASTALGGAVTVATPIDFRTQVYGSTYPYEGVLVVTGVSGGKVRLTALDDEWGPPGQVMIEVDANGDGLFEAVLYRDWFELAAG